MVILASYASVSDPVTSLQVDGKKVRGRRYPWGVVQIESMEHSDFIPLRNMLVSRVVRAAKLGTVT